MLIQSGAVATLSTCQWVALELTSESRTDEIVLHLVRWAVRHLESANIPFQLLYPIASRGPAQPSLLSPYLWMRVPNPRLLRPATSIMGLSGIVSGATGNPILISHAPFMADLIEQCRASADSWSAGIAPGSGVRILLGPAHGLCGTVESLSGDGDASVRVALRSRAIRLRVPVRVLRNLGAAPADYFMKEEL